MMGRLKSDPELMIRMLVLGYVCDPFGTVALS
jgi:hypothetical protein